VPLQWIALPAWGAKLAHADHYFGSITGPAHQVSDPLRDLIVQDGVFPFLGLPVPQSFECVRAHEGSKFTNSRSATVSFPNRLREAIACGERSIALVKHLDLKEQMAYSLDGITRACLGTGRMARAAKALEESIDVWRELGNLPRTADNLINSARIGFVKGDFEETLTLQEEGRLICQSLDNR
jgi:hypothetical protein